MYEMLHRVQKKYETINDTLGRIFFCSGDFLFENKIQLAQYQN